MSTTQTLYPAYAQTNAAVLSNTTKLAPNNIITDTGPVIPKEGLQINKVKYFDNESGYLTYPSATNISAPTSKKLPAIIMIHEFWGINDNIRSMARTLAKQTGYVVLAVDLFKGQSTKDPNKAMQLVKSVRDNQHEAISNLQAAVKFVSSLPLVNSYRLVFWRRTITTTSFA